MSKSIVEGVWSTRIAEKQAFREKRNELIWKSEFKDGAKR